MLPDIDPEWQQLAALNPEARSRAQALRQRTRDLWQDRQPTTDELFDDDVCFNHLMWLQSTRHGGLAEFLGPCLSGL